MNEFDIIVRPHITEKSTSAVAEGKITITISEEDVEYSRYSDGDIEL